MKVKGPIIVTVLLAALFAAVSAGASEISVKAVVEPAVVPVGSEATLLVTVEGKFSKSSEPDMPALDDFAVYRAGSSQSFSIVNGRRSSSLQYTYVLVPRREGHFTIAPIRFTAGGKVYTANHVEIEVVAAAATLPVPTDRGAAPGDERADDPIYIRARVDRDTVYVNQQVTWTMGFYTDGRVDLLRSPEYHPPNAEGFWVEDLPPQKNYYRMIEGRKYLVNEIKRACFPTVPGEYKIGSARVDIVVDDFATRSFDDFFKRRRGVFGFGKSNTLRSNEIAVTVLPLPQRGRPANFSGLVGRNMRISLKADKQLVRAGDPINMTLEISGEGNFKALAAPDVPQMDGFKMYESGSKSDLFKKEYVVTGRKKTDFVLIPKVEGETVIPPVQLSYFDPVDERYKIIQSNSIHMKIEPGVKEEGGRQIVFAGSGEDIEVLGRDINYIHPVPARIATAGRPFYRSTFYLAAHALPLLALFFSFAIERRRKRWRDDTALARSSRAARDADKKLKNAHTLEKGGITTEVFAAVSGALRDYFADKMNQSAAGLTLEDIEGFLAANKVDEADGDLLRSTLRTCDVVQYSPSPGDADRAKDTIETAVDIVRLFEKKYLR